MAASTWDWWLGLSWAAWALLWLMFFLLLALQKPIARATAWMAIVQGVGTAWLPGYLLLTGTLLLLLCTPTATFCTGTPLLLLLCCCGGRLMGTWTLSCPLATPAPGPVL